MNSMGFDKPERNTRVVVAMSGGVDSSVVAAVLAAEGYDVVGITLQLYDHGAVLEKQGACCAGSDIHDARRVAESIGIPHYVLDYESRFRAQVIDDFADSYLRGETPIPCIRCNQTVKFRDLFQTAQDLGADCLATGHYVERRVLAAGEIAMFRGADPARDQSYFLFATTPDQLAFLRFPLGGMLKSDVRSLADRHGLAVADKPDSQDICFVPGGRYAELVKKLRPDGVEPGEIVDLNGRVLGTHEGIIHYTVGQRRGLNIGGLEEPLYVVRLDAAARRVVVGPKSALATTALRLTDMNWLTDPQRAGALAVKVRSTSRPAAATVDRAAWHQVRFVTPEEGVSPGQACVVYAGNRVIGGGWIAETQPADPRLLELESA